MTRISLTFVHQFSRVTKKARTWLCSSYQFDQLIPVWLLFHINLEFQPGYSLHAVLYLSSGLQCKIVQFHNVNIVHNGISAIIQYPFGKTPSIHYTAYNIDN